MQRDLDHYLAQVQSGGVLPQTIDNYRRMLLPVLAFVGKQGCRRIADITRDDLTAYLIHLVEVGRSKKGRLGTHELIRRFFAWLQEAGRIVVNPAKGLPLPDDGEEDLPVAPLSEVEVAGIIDGMPRANVLDLRAVCLLELLYGCGLRLSEVLRLDLSDIDMTRRTVVVRTSKHGQIRVVPLPQTARVALQTYLSLRRTLLCGPDTGALLVSARGGRRLRKEAVYDIFARLNEAGGEDARHLHPHLFRHSIAVHLLRRGADIRHIQEFLGHANLNTTKIYLRLVPGHLKEDYEKAMPEIETGLGVGQ